MAFRSDGRTWNSCPRCDGRTRLNGFCSACNRALGAYRRPRKLTSIVRVEKRLIHEYALCGPSYRWTAHLLCGHEKSLGTGGDLKKIPARTRCYVCMPTA